MCMYTRASHLLEREAQGRSTRGQKDLEGKLPRIQTAELPCVLARWPAFSPGPAQLHHLSRTRQERLNGAVTRLCQRCFFRSW